MSVRIVSNERAAHRMVTFEREAHAPRPRQLSRVPMMLSGASTAFLSTLAARTASSLNGERADIDYAMLVKLYGQDGDNERRYSPAQCIGTMPKPIMGRPDPAHISTSYVERHNWTVRTNMRGYTRLSNGFSRKIENHEAAVALNYFVYNFVKIHRALRVTPAMAAGVTNRLWDVSDLVALLVESESRKAA